MDSAFPGNSHQRQIAPAKKAAPEKAPEKSVAKVVSGEVVRRKQPMGKRLKAAFLGGDSQSVWDYVVGDVVVPAIKDTMVEAINGGVERLILGDNARGRSRGRYSSRGQFDYANISRGPMQGPRNQDPRQQLSRRAQTMHVFDEVVFPTRRDAEAVLSQMFELLDNFDHVTVSDFYEMAGISGNFMDQKWGWVDLRGVRPTRVRGGDWILDLPATQPID